MIGVVSCVAEPSVVEVEPQSVTWVVVGGWLGLRQLARLIWE